MSTTQTHKKRDTQSMADKMKHTHPHTHPTQTPARLTQGALVGFTALPQPR